MPLARTITHTTVADGTFSSTGATEWERAHTNAITGGVSGGIPYFDSTTSEASSALLASGGVVIGGGAANPPATSANLTINETGSVTGGPLFTVGTTGTSGVFSFGTISNTIGGIWASGLTNSAVNYAFGAYSGGTLINAPINTQIRARINDGTVLFLDSSTIRTGASEHLLIGLTPPTISSGFGTSPSVVANNTSNFRVNVGTGGTASSGVIAISAALTGWNAYVENVTAVAANRADQRTVVTAATTTTITVQNQTISTGAALAWTASDILQFIAFPY